MKKITEKAARKIFDEEGVIFLNHSASGFVGGIGAGLERIDGKDQMLQHIGFDQIVSSFKTKYCTGKNLHKMSFYIETPADIKRRNKQTS